MLKFTYTETGLHLEQLLQPLNTWINLRQILSCQVNLPFMIEHCTASFLLPVAQLDLSSLQRAIEHEPLRSIELAIADTDFIEVTLTGIWLSSSTIEAEGVFVAALGDRLESVLITFWQDAKLHHSALQH